MAKQKQINYGEAIRTLIDKHQLSTYQVADLIRLALDIEDPAKMPINQSSIHRWAKGTMAPRGSTAVVLDQVLPRLLKMSRKEVSLILAGPWRW